METTPSPQQNKNKAKSSRQFVQSYRVLLLYRSQVGAICLGLGLLLLGTFTGILKPWPIALLLDTVLGNNPLPGWMGSLGQWFTRLDREGQILFCAVSIFAVHLIYSGVTSLQNYVVIRIGLKGLRTIRQQVFNWMQNLSQSYFLNQKQGDVIYRVCWDTYSFQTLFQHVWFSSTASFLSMFCMLWVMWQLNEMLTFISCITLPMLILGIRVYGQVMKLRSMEAHKADSQVASFIQQTVNTIPTIQSFVRQNRVAQRFNVFIQDAWGKRLSQHATEIIYQTTVAAIFSLGMAGIIWAGAREVLADRLTVGELVVFITYLSQFYEPLQKLILAGSTLADAQAGVSRVFEILDTPPAITSPANGITLETNGQKGFSIEFENVSFGYLPRHPIIRNATFSVKPGEFVAIVGPSGAGKTTLAKLISRFFDPEQGSVKINGVDLRRYDLDSLRRNVSVVHQEPLILPGTLRDNILFGREGATEEEMVEVAEQVHAAEFIGHLPQRYDTTVGDGGSRLSIGEVQRLCLARALLKNAPILILDEPTSSLDAENQMYVVDALGRLAKGRTTLMIAHRLSTLVNATRIIVLVDGQIQATGTHDELLETSEYYRRAVEAGSRSIQAD